MTQADGLKRFYLARDHLAHAKLLICSSGLKVILGPELTSLDAVGEHLTAIINAMEKDMQEGAQ